MHIVHCHGSLHRGSLGIISFPSTNQFITRLAAKLVMSVILLNQSDQECDPRRISWGTSHVGDNLLACVAFSSNVFTD